MGIRQGNLSTAPADSRFRSCAGRVHDVVVTGEVATNEQPELELTRLDDLDVRESGATPVPTIL